MGSRSWGQGRGRGQGWGSRSDVKVWGGVEVWVSRSGSRSGGQRRGSSSWGQGRGSRSGHDRWLQGRVKVWGQGHGEGRGLWDWGQMVGEA